MLAWQPLILTFDDTRSIYLRVELVLTEPTLCRRSI